MSISRKEAAGMMAKQLRQEVALVLTTREDPPEDLDAGARAAIANTLLMAMRYELESVAIDSTPEDIADIWLFKGRLNEGLLRICEEEIKKKMEGK